MGSAMLGAVGKEKTTERSKSGITIRKYSDNSFVVYGEETKDIKDNLMELGGRWNPNLAHPIYGKSQKLKGYIFSMKKREGVESFFSSKGINAINTMDAAPAVKTANAPVEEDPNRQKVDRYTGINAIIREYMSRYFIIYGDEFPAGLVSDLKEIGFEKSNTIRNPNSGKVISAYKGPKIKRQSLVTLCLMQDINYIELKDDQADKYADKE